MGAQRPVNPDLAGDESAVSPRQTNEGLLGHRRGTDQTKRIETDDQNNLFVRLAVDDTAVPSTVSALASGSLTAIPASTVSTIVTYTAPSAKNISRIIFGTRIFHDTVETTSCPW